VSAEMIVFGIFMLITLNINSSMDLLKDQPEIIVFCFPELNDEQISKIESEISGNDKIDNYTKVSKKEGFEELKEMLGYNKNLLEDLDESFVPIKFVIKLKNPDDSTLVADTLFKTHGVEDVRYPQQVIELISNASKWIRIVSILLIGILLVVSVFIISNTIKLTVFARRREIGIMKYIGATDWFIRWPFIVEGVLIGFIGAIVAFALLSYAYITLENKLHMDLSGISMGFIRLISFGSIAFQTIGIYLLAGLLVGALGSVISIRKYLKV
jgi:cell division transport system permease protein